MNSIEIEAKADLKCYVIHAEVATLRYPYMLPVLRHVESHDGRTNAKILSTDLFPGLKPLSQKILDICEDEGYVKRIARGKYKLTDNGREAIRDNRLFVRGSAQAWKIHYTDCDLIPKKNRLVRLETANSKEAGYDHIKKTEQPQLENMPDHITDLEGQILTCISGEIENEFKLYNILKKGKQLEPSQMLRWNCHLVPKSPT